MAEPTVNKTTVDWDFEDDTDYTLSGAVLNDDVDGEAGFILTLQTGAGAASEEFEESDPFAEWYDHSTLTEENTDSSGGIVKFGDQAAKASSAGLDTSSENFWGGVGNRSHVEFWFYYDGLSALSNLRSIFLPGGGAIPPFALRTGIGIDSDISTTNWAWWNIANGAWEDLGIIRSTGWHSFRYSFWLTNDIDHQYTWGRIYLDNTKISTFDGVDDLGNWGRAKSFGVTTQESSRVWYLDRIRGNKSGNLYSTSGTAVTPKAQPDAVESWDSIATDEDENQNGYKGTVTYQFQWSTDGGGSWNGSWLDASDSNLAGISCDGDGQDAIKFRAFLEDEADRVFTPRARGITLSYTPVPITVSADALAAVGAAGDLGVLPGAVATPMDALGGSGATQALAVTPGGVTSNMTTLAALGGVPSAAVVPGAVVAAVDALIGTAAVSSLAVVPGSVVTEIDRLTASAAVQTVGVVPGGVAISLARLIVVSEAGAVTVSVTGEPQIVAVDALVAASSALSASVVPGGYVVQVDVLPAALALGSFSLKMGILVLPDGRGIRVSGEDRIVLVDGEGRTVVVSGEGRVTSVPSEGRVVVSPGEDRITKVH